MGEIARIHYGEKSNPTYWTFARDGEPMFDADFDSAEQALAEAEEIFAEENESISGWRDGDSTEEQVMLIEFIYNERCTERHVVGTKLDTIRWEKISSDFSEHNVWHSGGGGVL